MEEQSTSVQSAVENAPSGPRKGAYLASTVKHGLIYFLGNVLARLAGFVMLPVYTHLLTARDYGILEILTLSADILSMLAGLGIRQAVMRLYYQYDTEEDRNAVVSTASLLVISVFAAIAVLGLLFSKQITAQLLSPTDSVIYVRLAVLAFVFGAVGDIPGVHLQAQQRSSIQVLSNFVRLVLALSLNILFVVVMRMGIAGIFLSTILSSMVVGGYMAVRMFRETGVRFVPQKARELIGFGTPLVASQFGSFVLHFSDRFFLRHFHTLAIVGVYALSYKFAMMIAMLIAGPFYSIWNAKALEIARREGDHAPPILRGILLQFNLLLVTAGLGMSLFATDVIHFMLGPDFQGADRAVPVLSLAMVLFCARNISQTGAIIAKRPGLIAVVTTMAAGAALLLNLLLIPRWAGMGAATATAVAFGLEFVVMLAYSERAYRIGISYRDVFAPTVLATAVWVIATLAVPTGAGEVTGLGIRIAAFGLFGLALSATGILTPEAQKLIVRSLREPRAIIKALQAA